MASAAALPRRDAASVKAGVRTNPFWHGLCIAVRDWDAVGIGHAHGVWNLDADSVDDVDAFTGAVTDSNDNVGHHAYANV